MLERGRALQIKNYIGRYFLENVGEVMIFVYCTLSDDAIYLRNFS